MENTTIAEDLKKIESIYSTLADTQELPVVNKVEKKAGFDPENGKYTVDGAVVLGKVTDRGKNSRAGEACGYKITRYALSDTGEILLENDQPVSVEYLYVTKEQAIHLVQFFGARNAYIRLQERADKQTVFLRPVPAKTEAFFLDGKLQHAYVLDDYGDRKLPITLAIEQHKCSVKLWAILNADCLIKRKREKPRKDIQSVQRENEKEIQKIKESLIQTNSALINPFAKK